MELPKIEVKRVLLCRDCTQASKSAEKGKALCRLRQQEVGLDDRACRLVTARPR